MKEQKKLQQLTRWELFPCSHCKKTNHPKEKCWWRLNVKCRKCGDLRRIERIYKSKSKETNLTLEEIEDNQIFVARFFTTTKTSNDSWLINSGCTNYMTNNKKHFRELDKTSFLKWKLKIVISS